MGRVVLTQYLRPNGERQLAIVEVDDALAALAVGMELSCEVLMGGEVAIYGRWRGEDEDDEHMELATNGPGPRNPQAMVRRVIEAVGRRPRPVPPVADKEE